MYAVKAPLGPSLQDPVDSIYQRTQNTLGWDEIVELAKASPEAIEPHILMLLLMEVLVALGSSTI